MTGFGRCGAWFAGDLWDVVPDLMTFAKGVNSGYVPVGGVLRPDAVAAHFAHRRYPGGLDLFRAPAGLRLHRGGVRVREEENLVDRGGRTRPRRGRPGAGRAGRAHPIVGDVRGVGLAWAVELVRDRATREPLAPYAAPGTLAPEMAAVLAACKRQGVWPLAAGNRLHLFPPLVITEDELRDGLVEVGAVLAE